MPEANAAAMKFLLNRRSRPAKTLQLPVPTRDALMPILTAAARSPDHGQLEPWRFIVLERAALTRLASIVTARGAALRKDAESIAKQRAQFAEAHLAIAVVSVPRPSPKVPEVEQVLSAGAVCLSLLNAALASGWGANWLTGWASHDRAFLSQGLDLAKTEFLAGFVHIGTEGAVPPERPRPDIERIVRWVEA